MSNTPIIGATYDERANSCAKYLHTQMTLLGKPEDYLTEEAWERELETIASTYRHNQAKIDYPNSIETYTIHVAYPIITAIDKVDTSLYNNTPVSTPQTSGRGFFARIFGI